MTNFRIQKLDRRHNGYGIFTHYIEPHKLRTGIFISQWKNDKMHFIEIRQWFWENFGPSRELQLISLHDDDLPSLQWAWDSQNNYMRVYTKEKSLEWFLLKCS